MSETPELTLRARIHQCRIAMVNANHVAEEAAPAAVDLLLFGDVLRRGVDGWRLKLLKRALSQFDSNRGVWKDG